MTSSPKAYSPNGHTFHVTLEIGEDVGLGSYVTLEVEDGRALLGQILEIGTTFDQSGAACLSGSGEIRAVIGENGAVRGKTSAFRSATVSPFPAERVAAYLEEQSKGSSALGIGELRRQSGDAAAHLIASGFGRHTLVCGQSGSGKTYSLGVILERLLHETDLRIVVLDPNSDYVRLGEARQSDDTEKSRTFETYGKDVEGLAVHGARPEQQPLRSRFGRLPILQQALVLDLDPLRDAHEYNAFLRIVKDIGTTEYTLTDVRTRAASMFDDAARDLSMRIENLGVEDLGIWAPVETPAMTDLVSPDCRALVLDLGSLSSAGERSMMAASTVAYFWEARHHRNPTLLVIDEAHNVCPAVPSDRFQSMATEELIAIAGEGRKFGLYLLLVTQRPQKLHPNVLSQCENVILMRMNSTTDIDHLSTVFSHVPSSLLHEASGFGLGEGLAAGRISGDPMFFKTGERWSYEGGSDIPSTWARKERQ